MGVTAILNSGVVNSVLRITLLHRSKVTNPLQWGVVGIPDIAPKLLWFFKPNEAFSYCKIVATNFSTYGVGK
jgi:hypothetical protein